MRNRIALAALALFLLPAAARADTILFGNPNFTFSAQAGQQVGARIVSFTCSPSSVPSGFNCGDTLIWNLRAYDPTGAVVASQTVFWHQARSLNLLFIATLTGDYRVTFGAVETLPGSGLRGATWMGEVTINDPVPEPATLLLLGTGLAGIGASVRRRRGARAVRGAGGSS